MSPGVIVVDASVVCKWLYDEELSYEARRLLTWQGFGAQSSQLYAPSLLLAEVGNVIWKKTKKDGGTIPAAHLLGLLHDCVKLVNDEILYTEALDISISIGHPIYDCFYLSCAMKMRCVAVTCDRRLIGKLQGTDYESLVVDLSEFVRTAH